MICLCNWRASCRRVFHTSRIKPTTYCNEFPIFVLRTMIVFWLIIFVCLLFALSELCVSTWFMIMSAFDWGCSLFDFQTWPHFTTDPRLRCSSRTRYSLDRCIYTITSGLRSEYFHPLRLTLDGSHWQWHRYYVAVEGCTRNSTSASLFPMSAPRV